MYRDRGFCKYGSVTIDTNVFEYGYLFSSQGCNCDSNSDIDTCDGGGGFGFVFVYHFLEWKIERLVWLAFEKNDNNDNCGLSTVPKDVLKHILSYLKSIEQRFGLDKY